MEKKKTSNHIDYIEFPARNREDLQRAKEFFTAVFEWSYTDWGEDYADTASSGVGSGINGDASHRPQTPLAVIYTNDLDSVRQKVVLQNGTITKDIFSFPGGWRFQFQDPAGNELAVWSDIDPKSILTRISHELFIGPTETIAIRSIIPRIL